MITVTRPIAVGLLQCPLDGIVFEDHLETEELSAAAHLLTGVHHWAYITQCAGHPVVLTGFYMQFLI